MQIITKDFKNIISILADNPKVKRILNLLFKRNKLCKKWLRLAKLSERKSWVRLNYLFNLGEYNHEQIRKLKKERAPPNILVGKYF